MDAEVIAKGVRQTAALWREEDGTEDDFCVFVQEHIARTAAEKEHLFDQLSMMLETLNGASDRMAVELGKATILAGPDPTEVDYILGAYNPLSHMSDDLFANKIAFITMLNFPEYSLAEKEAHAAEWSRLEWAYARMGDRFTSRVPALVTQHVGQAYSDAENYIADYNIMMDHLLTEDDRRLFPEGMVLLSHWNLRDELKSNYADVPNAKEKQEMIYQVMQRIVTQTIPACVINSAEYDWKPYSNLITKVTLSEHEAGCSDKNTFAAAAEEADVRYQHIINQFHTYQEVDAHTPGMPTAIQRNFEGDMQVSAEQIESLFTQLLTSEQVAGVAALIRERLGRDLRPYDIWYDGFKARASMPESGLTAETQRRYPSVDAFRADMPRLLDNLGFTADDARYLQERIEVEAARGSGHAWPCMDRTSPARLRTRAVAGGLDYKGFNIAAHEFGHNVEQVLSLYRMDYYTLSSIPNTGFTEAMAFLFQMRDLQLLGYGDYHADDMATLDAFWSMYEIMGVSLLDMQMWQWLYAHPKATAAELKEQTLTIAREIWNRYYAPHLGETDSPILAIYSHMVDVPMYLPNYPFGHLIHFQLEEHLAKCPDKQAFARELIRIYTQGKLTPNAWMQGAVGADVSVEPVLHAVERVLTK